MRQGNDTTAGWDDGDWHQQVGPVVPGGDRTHLDIRYGGSLTELAVRVAQHVATLGEHGYRVIDHATGCLAGGEPYGWVLYQRGRRSAATGEWRSVLAIPAGEDQFVIAE